MLRFIAFLMTNCRQAKAQARRHFDIARSKLQTPFSRNCLHGRYSKIIVRRRIISYVSEAVRRRAIRQQGADDIQMTLLSCLMQRRVAMLQYNTPHHRLTTSWI